MKTWKLKVGILTRDLTTEQTQTNEEKVIRHNKGGKKLGSKNRKPNEGLIFKVKWEVNWKGDQGCSQMIKFAEGHY